MEFEKMTSKGTLYKSPPYPKMIYPPHIWYVVYFVKSLKVSPLNCYHRGVRKTVPFLWSPPQLKLGPIRLSK